MENFHDLAVQRRSIRKYTDKPLSSDEVRLILETALMSPAGKRKNPWQFIAIEDKEMLQQLSVAKEHGAGPLAAASLALVVAGDPYTSDTWMEDCSIASLMIQLQCEDLGLGSCWIQIHKRYAADGRLATDVVRDLLMIPPQYEVLSIISIGHKAEEKKPFDTEKLQWEKVHIGYWKQEQE